MNKEKIGVIGLGYVGLPLAVEVGKYFDVVGFDINQKRIQELCDEKIDTTHEVENSELEQSKVLFTSDEDTLRDCTFYIVTVPTPIDEANRPDLSLVMKASQVIGKYIKKGDIIVYESTVYPGVTEDICAPILEKVSNLKYQKDFCLGYSPERINPGDKKNRLPNIKKIISASSSESLQRLRTVYGQIIKAGLFEAASIKTAEAAKVIENIQRDVNIALANELSLIFSRLNIDTHDVLDAASSKWNFIRYEPGLVGGHCIGVDPYYLTHCAELVGYHPEVILSGRRINNSIGQEVAYECIKNLIQLPGSSFSLSVTIFGGTFKEDVPDIRNSKVCDIIETLHDFGVQVQVHDPHADPEEFFEEYGVKLTNHSDLKQTQGYILAVKHKKYMEEGWDLIEKLSKDKKVFVYDLKSILPRDQKPENIILKRS